MEELACVDNQMAPETSMKTYGWASVMMWGCVSHYYKLDLFTVQDNLNRPRLGFQRDILETVVVRHFDNHFGHETPA